MIYLDSCILIYRLDGKPVFRSSVVDAMRAQQAAFCISDLVRLECLVGPILPATRSARRRSSASSRRFGAFP
jgi:hypothetical protein